LKAEPPKSTDAAGLTLTVVEGHLAVCQLDTGVEIPGWATVESFFSVMRTEDELSIVCPEERVPEGVTHEKGWRALKLAGPFELSMVGILSSVAAPLARTGASIFAVSTFDTDYVLLEEGQLDVAVDTLRERGHEADTTYKGE
jgi:uncharacterized protein